MKLASHPFYKTKNKSYKRGDRKYLICAPSMYCFSWDAKNLHFIKADVEVSC